MARWDAAQRAGSYKAATDVEFNVEFSSVVLWFVREMTSLMTRILCYICPEDELVDGSRCRCLGALHDCH